MSDLGLINDSLRAAIATAVRPLSGRMLALPLQAAARVRRSAANWRRYLSTGKVDALSRAV